MSNSVRYLLVTLFFILLIAVRAFVEPYFYDPLLEFFKNDYLHMALPELEFPKYFLHIFFRYSLNSLISLAIIYLIYKEKQLLFFSYKLYFIAFIFFITVLFILLKYSIFETYLVLFYVRRFLIQPLILLILVPAFYYQKINTTTELK